MLRREEHSLRCENGHCFDIARQGYVNLLPVTQKHSKAPGDTLNQVAARKSFLDSGAYLPIADQFAAMVKLLQPKSLLDIGCGEGWYLEQLLQRCEIEDPVGIDISKDAVRYAAVRCRNVRFYTATAAHLPFPDGSFDVLSTLFALTLPGEFARVLKPGGHCLQVTAGAHHLWALKGIIYPELFEKEDGPEPELPGFRTVQEQFLEFPIHLEGNGAVMALLGMTPHIMRITKEGMERARSAETLDDTAQIRFRLFEKITETV